MIKRLDATFDPKDHGHANFTKMVKAMESIVKIKRARGRDGPSASRALSDHRTDCQTCETQKSLALRG
jgi:hypothetical protein